MYIARITQGIFPSRIVILTRRRRDIAIPGKRGVVIV
jgi:hypothetical protein